MVILTRCHLQLNNLNKLLFVKKNGLMTLRLVVNLFFNLVELFETDAKLEELKKFEGTFERDVVLEIYCII